MPSSKKLKRILLFDTLSYVKQLEQVGVSQEQAEVQVRLFANILEENICSKQNLLETKGELELKFKELDLKMDTIHKDLRGEIESNRKDLTIEIESNRKDLTTEIQAVKKDLTIQIGEFKWDIIKWFIGTFLVSMGTIIGMMTFMIRFLRV